MKKEHSPAARGFDKVFSFLAGSGNHFNYEPQFDDSKFKLPFANKLWMEGDRYIDRKTEIPTDFYSTTYATKRMLDFLKARTPEECEKPFFAYLAYLAPHWPLQAPRERVQSYCGWYDEGPTKLQERRIAKMIELGLLPPDIVPATPEVHVGKRWDEMSEAQKKESARKMEVYAAMVEMIDEGVGQVVEYLESTGELDNTFVLFMSDNGAEGLMWEAIHLMGNETTMADVINTYYNNSLENIGERDSFVWYGPEWASAATAPSRGWKAWPTEGGIRCPCIVRYPRFNSLPEAVTHCFTNVMDILPTVLQLAGVLPVGSNFHDREVVPVKGKSWVPHLSSKDYSETSVHDESEHVHGWELIGLRAIRKGPWKAVWMHPPRGTGEWELFNVLEDQAESKDLASQEPEKLKELIGCWEEYYAETGMFDYGFEFRMAKA